MVTEADFQRAVSEPEYRQQFVRSVDLGDAAKYIRKVNYSTKIIGTDISEYVMGTIKPRLARMRFRHIRSDVFVFPDAFSPEVHEIVGDFLSDLTLHEAFHAQESYENSIPLSNSELMKALSNVESAPLFSKLKMAQYLRQRFKAESEIRAYRRQFEAINNGAQNVSDLHVYRTRYGLHESFGRVQRIIYNAKHDPKVSQVFDDQLFRELWVQIKYK